MLPNSTCVLIYSVTKCVLEDVLKIPILKTLQYLQKNIRDGVYVKEASTIENVAMAVLTPKSVIHLRLPLQLLRQTES